MVAHACNPVTQEAEHKNCLNQEVEAAVSRDHITALQPGQQSKTQSQKNKLIKMTVTMGK